MKKLYKLILVLTIFFGGLQYANAQKMMGIGTDKPNPRAVLELNVENPVGFPQGFLPPRLTSAQRDLISTPPTGLTVYVTDVQAFFVYNGTIWVQLASSGSTAITATGINGVTATASGLNITINGANFVQNLQNLVTGDVVGNFQQGLTVTGIRNFPITGVPAAGNVLSFDGTNFIFATPISSVQQITTITGANGITVGGTGFDLTIGGNNLLNTSSAAFGSDLTGAYGALSVTGLKGFGLTGTPTAGQIVSFDGTAFQFVTPQVSTQTQTTITGANGLTVAGTGFDLTIGGNNLLNTSSAAFGTDLTGAYGALSVTGIQGYGIAGAPATGNILSFNGTNFVYATPQTNAVASVVGAGGVVVNTTGTLNTVSVSGLSIFSQSFANPIGTPITAFGTNPLFKAPVFIPSNVQRLRIRINAYTLSAGTANIELRVDGTPIGINGVVSTLIDNFIEFSSGNINAFANSSRSLSVFAEVPGGAAEAVYIQGISITVLE